MPNLNLMKLNGACADALEGIYPTLTFPAHASLVTGVNPAHHGIIHDFPFNPPAITSGSRQWTADDLKAEPLWAAVKKAGLLVSAVGWPLINGTDIVWPYQDHTKKDGANSNLSSSDDDAKIEFAEKVIVSRKPQLVLIHLEEPGLTIRSTGMKSKSSIEAAEKTDARLGRLLRSIKQAGIEKETTIFLVSTHGFFVASTIYNPNTVFVDNGFLTLDGNSIKKDWGALAWPAGGSCPIYLKSEDPETVKKLQQIFTKVLTSNKSPIYRLLTLEDLKKMGAFPGAVMALEAQSGYAFGDSIAEPAITKLKKDIRAEGFLPTRAGALGSLIVVGQGVRVGARVPLARIIDLAPTISRILKLDMQNMEGAPLEELFFLPKPESKKPASKQSEGLVNK